MRRITERHQNHTWNLAPLLQTLCLGLFVVLLLGSRPQLTMAQVSGSVTQVTESLKADPIIISVTAPPSLSTLITSSSVLSTSWSQSKPYIGVSIAVLVDSAAVGQTPTADAYLTTRIGPGTTAMDEIAHTRFTVPAELPVCSPSSCGAMVTLFSGLSLGPGEYFVTLSPAAISSGTVGWFPSLNPTVLVDTGVSKGTSFIAHAVAPYPPASAFEPDTVGTSPPFPPIFVDTAMNITVTGTAAPVNVNSELSGRVKLGTSTFNPQPVPDGPAGTFAFAAEFCNIGDERLIFLKSVTAVLTGGSTLLNRDSGTPPGVGSELTFAANRDYMDLTLDRGECVDVPYVIGLARRAPFEFFVDVLGVITDDTR